MKKNILAIICIIIVVVLNAFAFAQRHFEGKSTFNVTTANQTFDVLQKKLEKYHNYNSILYYVEKMEDLKNSAKDCVATSESHLKIINDLLKSTQVDAATQLQRADFQYLQSKQTHYAQQLSECRLLLYRSKETLASYKDVMQALGTDEILQRSTPIWKLSEEQIWDSLETISADKMLKMSGIALVSKNQWYSAFAFMLLASLLSLYIRGVLKRAWVVAENTHSLWEGLLASMIRFVVPCSTLGVFVLFLDAVFQEVMPTPTLELASQAGLLYLIAAATARYFFYPSAQCRGIFALPAHDGKRLYSRILFLMGLLFLGYVVAMLVREQSLAAPLVELARTLYLTLVSVVAIWIFILWYRSPYAGRFQHGSLAVLLTTFIFGLVILILLEWVGYHRLAIFAIWGLCLTMVYTLVTVALWRVVNALYQLLDNTQYSSARYVHQWLGVKANKQLHEVVLVRMAAHFSVLCFYFVGLLKSWSASPVFLDGVIDGLLYGFKFFGLTIVPLRLVLACVVFSVIFLIGRVIAAMLLNREQFKGEEHTQIAVSTITIYLFFAVAFIFAMFVTGVDFTGLAIIAGALSVGVGLGLQSVVNNFVSGLILLLEKPIKPGDRIVIGKTEGFVRKIRIRSTQIATLSKEDVIVPNADFMSQQVINYMFRDRYSRISCQVGVAYGSDVHLVKKTLMEIASQHTEVVQEAPNAPVVLFSRFGESSLIFDLWCVIYDVNKKSLVVSDLNFAIDAAFREHKIEIAFPQCEVRIKNNDMPLG